MYTALGAKLGKTEQAVDSAKLGSQTVAQWDAKIDAKAGFSVSASVDEVNFPVGSYLAVHTNMDVSRNNTATIRIRDSNPNE